jgi:replicative DNA helicase
MMALYENRDPIDVLTVSDWLKKVGSNWGRAYLSELSNRSATSHVPKYAQV